MLGELLPRGGGDPIPLLRDRLLIGRRSRCDVVLDFPNVSSHHCELQFVNGHWKIVDLNSSNGIKVNGERCMEHWLSPGDEVSIAKHHFVISYTPTSDAPVPVEEEDPFAMSLLEKAGLQRREAQRRRMPVPRAAHRPVETPGKINADDEIAFGFLSDD